MCAAFSPPVQHSPTGQQTTDSVQPNKHMDAVAAVFVTRGYTVVRKLCITGWRKTLHQTPPACQPVQPCTGYYRNRQNLPRQRPLKFKHVMHLRPANGQRDGAGKGVSPLMTRSPPSNWAASRRKAAFRKLEKKATAENAATATRPAPSATSAIRRLSGHITAYKRPDARKSVACKWTWPHCASCTHALWTFHHGNKYGLLFRQCAGKPPHQWPPEQAGYSLGMRKRLIINEPESANSSTSGCRM